MYDPLMRIPNREGRISAFYVSYKCSILYHVNNLSSNSYPKSKRQQVRHVQSAGRSSNITGDAPQSQIVYCATETYHPVHSSRLQWEKSALLTISSMINSIPLP
jgi:hypothetical protein